MGLGMAQGITMGMPLFGTPQDFIATMKGKGPLGSIMFPSGAGGAAGGLGLKPVQKFLSESDFAKSIATESKVFSIYAVGVVKGYKRETRVKVHAVVDFRSAPLVNLTSAAPAPAPTASATPAAGAPGTDPNALLAALQPSVGGQVLYYTIE
jgi:general secretion pathway protein K